MMRHFNENDADRAILIEANLKQARGLAAQDTLRTLYDGVEAAIRLDRVSDTMEATKLLWQRLQAKASKDDKTTALRKFFVEYLNRKIDAQGAEKVQLELLLPDHANFLIEFGYAHVNLGGQITPAVSKLLLGHLKKCGKARDQNVCEMLTSGLSSDERKRFMKEQLDVQSKTINAVLESWD